jgi:hypothetical protein
MCAGDFGNRGGNAARKRFAGRDRVLRTLPARADQIDEFGVEQHRRAQPDNFGDVGLIMREPDHDAARRVFASCNRVGERAPHQR